MDYKDFVAYANYIRLAVLAIVVLLAIIGAVRRSRTASDKRDLAHGIFAFFTVLIVGVVSSGTSWLYVVVFYVIGFAIGFLLGRIRPLTAWIVAFSHIYFAMAILWDQGGYAAAGIGILAMAAAIPLAQWVRAKMAPTASFEEIAAKPSIDGSTEGTWDAPQA